ncbi:hypothetical protein F4775DRAFT_85198 [Biscogniauxia sp. FL1348]|nr:hypothetical protein F4775DRAFT_85198 [Biscogniauxia sp. FL1348]
MSSNYRISCSILVIVSAMIDCGSTSYVPSQASSTSVLSISTSRTATGLESPTTTLPTTTTDVYRNDPCGIANNDTRIWGDFECPTRWVCAYDPSLSIAGCAASDTSPTFSHSMYTSCRPYTPHAVQFLGSKTSDNCGENCGNEALVTSCGPVTFGFLTVENYHCATKHLLAGSSNFRQLYCTASPTEYSITLSHGPGYSTPLSKIDLLEALRSTDTQGTEGQKGSAQNDQKWIAVASVSGVLLLVLVVAAVWLYRTRPRVHSAQGDEKVGVEDESFQEASRVLSYQERLGKVGILSIFLPVPLIMASLGLLITFWVTPTQPDNETLRQVIIENKLPIIIAICSLVIRLSSATQTALAISMMASIALENHFVGITEIPTLLIQRSNNGVSYDLPILFLGMMRSTPRLRLAKMAVPLCLLTAMSTTLQSSSAILLSDLGSAHIPGTNLSEPFPLGFDYSPSSQGRGIEQNNIDYSAAPPVAYPPFAELVSIPSRNTSQADLVIKRAFLPLSSQTKRQSLRNFTGYATMIDASTKCVRPILQDLSLRVSGSPDFVAINASISLDTYMADGIDQKLYFDEYFLDLFSNSSNMDQYALPGYSGRLNRHIWCTIYSPPLDLPKLDIDDLSFMCSSGGVRAFAFVNLLSLNKTASSQQPTRAGWWAINNISDITVDTDSKPPWTLIKYPNSPYAWQITLCSTKLEPKYQVINAWSDSPLVEKILVTDNDTKALNSTNLLLWLGATENKTTLTDRSVLAFEIPPGQSRDGTREQPWIGSTSMIRPLGGNPMGRYYVDGNMTYKLCEHCEPQYADGVAYFHTVYTKILRDVLASSPGGPALALQAFWTLVYQAYYYDNLPFFNIFSNSSSVLWEPVQVPTGWGGLAAVCGIMVAHLALFFAVLAVFLRRTRFSSVHDPWLAYTQAHTGELADALDEMHRRGLRDPGKLSTTGEAGAEKTVGLDLDILGRAVGVRRRHKKLMSDTDSSDDSH